MADGLSFKIGAEVSGAIQGMTAVEQRALVLAARIEKLQKVAGSTQSFDKLTQSLSLLKKTQAELASVKTPNVFQSVTKGSAEATASMVNLSRVVQDAPYGFIGIANNLNPLLESFQRLKASTGTTGGALKALGSSLTGAGGIGLALGLVTTAITFATSGFGAWTRGLFESKKEVNDLALELSNLANEIEASKTQLEGFNKEISFLKNIGGITADINFGGTEAELLKLRQGVVLSDEAVANSEKNIQKLAEIRKMAQELFYSTAPQDLKDAISPFTSYREIDMSVLDDFSDKNKKLVEGLKQADKEYYNAFALLEEEKNKNVISKAQLRLGIANKQKEEEKKRLEEQKKLYDEYVKNVISKAERLNSAYKNSITLKLDFEPEDETQQKFQKALKYLKNYADRNFQFSFAYDPKGGLPALPIEAPPDDETKVKAGEFGQVFYNELKSYFNRVEPIDVSLIKAVEDYKKIEDLAKGLGAAFENLKQTVITDGISGIAEGIGEALAGGNIGNAFKAFGNVIAGAVTEMGKQFIKLGTAALLAKKAITKLFANPALAIAAGAGLVVLGSALRTAMSGNFGGFRAMGGPVGAGKGYIVGERGPEWFQPDVGGRIIPNNQISPFMGGGSSSPFQTRDRQYIRGNNLVLVTARTNRSQSRLG